ncbi:MAG: sulfatase-like hydrolase/transferase [Phaeodactylibacter xiamenensis]|uniref:sulfatase-like hydrolase/transferase n=1 Tax=Phaeodactylibacter xiamenensis TaxID=1524460 RepID=UPI000696AA6F|nr:sulfatase-like hydrolase/transferase [Phaeodactylibacter xiamenensis]MCR9055104.1 sulfatase-like hydrolase/transferase [bacterium]
MAITTTPPWETHRVGAGGAVAWLRAEKGDERHHVYNVTTEVIRLMKETKDQPFFMAAGFIRPHVPWVAPKRYFEKFDSVDIQPIPVPATDREDMPKIAYDTWAGHFNLPETERREAMRAYYACTAFVDDQVGRLIAALKNQGLYDNTIVVLVSDHGYQLGEHGLWFKNFLFRESAIAPMIIRHPGIGPGIVEKVLELLDLYPTLAKMAELNAPANLEGRDMTALMQGQPQGWKNYAIVETRHQGVVGKAVYTPDWSYMDWGEHGEELYDLKRDVYQWDNLAGREEYRIVINALRRKLVVCQG